MTARALLLCVALAAPVSGIAADLSVPASVEAYREELSRPGSYALGDPPELQMREDQVKLSADVVQGGVQFTAHNVLRVPVQVELRLENLVNAQGGDGTRIVRKVLGPNATQTLAMVKAKPGQLLSYRSTLVQAMGAPSAVPVSGYRYAFPWVGGPFRVSQGFNGSYSHFGPKGRYAMDIAMPVGTTIVAARDGTVVQHENGQNGRGTNPSGNFVRILHSDGTMAVYLHLLQGSVVVQDGQRVKTGQVLAKSGNTGNSTGPHLHFVIQRNVGLALESIPYRFDRPISGVTEFTAERH